MIPTNQSTVSWPTTTNKSAPLCAKAKADIAVVGIVSCRNDLLGFYAKRGYRFLYQVPAENTTAELERLTRPGITLKYFQKQRKI